MGQLANDMIEGLMCSLCGVVFRKAHGYPVLCRSCWKDTPKDQRGGCQPAREREV